MGRYERTHITRRADALLRAALSDLGERGTVDLGSAHTRGTRRVWRAGGARPESMRVGIGYALHAGCTLTGERADVMHYASNLDRDATRYTSRARTRVPSRVGVRIDVRDADTGRKLVGAIVTGAPRTLSLGSADASNVRVRALQRDARVRVYVREGVC